MTRLSAALIDIDYTSDRIIDHTRNRPSQEWFWISGKANQKALGALAQSLAMSSRHFRVTAPVDVRASVVYKLDL
jgi:hypothetical protein